MSEFKPLRKIKEFTEYSKKDVLVVFGELFSRGYVNGIVDLAKSKGMKVIYSTVGRRDNELNLRTLNKEELQEKETPLINIPLEAGFDLEPAKNGITPVDQLQGVKMSEWDKVKLNWEQIEESRQAGTERFRQQVYQYMTALEAMIPEDANVLFVHTMAGGFPRAKVVMPVANRVFKGYGDRYLSSEYFWNSDIGRLCDMSFNDVTGETLQHLLELSTPLREKIIARGQRVSYVAYGYHGTEVLVNNNYQWQSYSPYLQGWAKLRLEEVAEKAFADGIQVTVFNCPEILTNSSSIFLGVEVSLYPLLGALSREKGSDKNVQSILSNCQNLLKPAHNIKEILNFCDKYLHSDVIKKWSQFDVWPQHNGPEQMKLMRESSSTLIEMHKDSKELITSQLSEVVFRACGKIMFHEAWEPREPVFWIGHDVISCETDHLTSCP